MTKEQLRDRCRALARDVLLVCDSMPQKTGAVTIAKQLARSASSASADYRAACRGRSKAEWLSKMGVVEEEADETQHWLELAQDCRYLDARQAEPLWREASEILAIVVASIRTGRGVPK
jgi:four helix bundle protein